MSAENETSLKAAMQQLIPQPGKNIQQRLMIDHQQINLIGVQYAKV
jgi:hypothetical protein